MEHSYDYDVAVTFAGEDRQFVQEVVRQVTHDGYKVFYDQDEQVNLWGEDLTEYFPKIYEMRSRYAVMFVSRHYAAKPWTRLERRSVLVRALNQPEPYLLPVRLDDTQLPGVRSSIHYLDGVAMGSAGVAMAIRQKLSGTMANGEGSFNGYVPRNEHQATILVGERPAGWEYLLFAFSLLRGVEQLHERYLDFSMGFAQPADYVAVEDVPVVARRELATVNSIVRNFGTVLSNRVQRSALGSPGEPGNVDQILHLASRYVAVYQSFIHWAEHLRSYSTSSDAAHEVFEALAMYAEQPIELMRNFVYEFRAFADSLNARLMAGEDVTHEPVLALRIPSAAKSRLDVAFDRYRRSLG